MQQLLTQLILNGISMSLQNDGAMITINMSKGIFKAHHVLPLRNVEQSSLELYNAITECRYKLEIQIGSIRKFPEVVNQSTI